MHRFGVRKSNRPDRLARPLGLILVAIACMVGCPIADAQGDLPAGVPTRATLEERLAQATGNNTLTEEARSQQVELLSTAIARLDTALEQQQQARAYAESITSAPLDRAEFEARAAEIGDGSLPADLASAPLAELQALVDAEEAGLTALRRRSTQLQSDLIGSRDFDIQSALIDARRPAPTFNIDATGSPELQAAQASFNATTGFMRDTRIRLLEQRLASRPVRQALLEAELNLVNRQIAVAEIRTVRLYALVADNRQSDADREVALAAEMIERVETEPEPIRMIAADIGARANELRSLVGPHDDVVREKESTAREIQRLEGTYGTLIEQLDIARSNSSPQFGAALRTQRDRLIEAESLRRELDAHERALTENRLLQFALNTARETNASQSAADVLATIDDNADEAETEDREVIVRELLRERVGIVDKLAAAYSSYSMDLADLIAQKRDLAFQSEQHAELLDQHLLWMPSSASFGAITLSDLRASLVWLASGSNWRNVLTTCLENIRAHPFYVFLGIVALVVMLYRRPRQLKRLARMKDSVGKVNRDKLQLTLIAVLTTLLLALPGPFAIVAVSGLLTNPGTFSGALSSALAVSATTYLILEFFLQCLRTNGLAELHFGWSPRVVHALKRNLPRFMAIFLPAIVLNLVIESQGTEIIRDSLGRIAFVATSIVLAVFAYRVLASGRGILKTESPDAVSWRVRYIAFPLMVLLPLAIAVLSILGYHYTAVQFDTYLLTSVVVVLGGNLLYFFIQRALAIGHRRLALDRVRAKRAAAAMQSENREAARATGDGVPTELDLQEIDLQTISTQTQALLKMFIFVGVGIALWNVWSGLLPAFRPLEDVQLWGAIELVNGEPLTVPITLWDLLVAVLVGVITFLAAKNIPGFLEVAFMSRMTLEPGTTYAVTTICRYLIVITGSIFALQIIGAQWSKLQWLIAALGVGLGFGLQEIVANFVSGIVLLFERPIRIGDTVTVGDQSGTVSRIRIRATTIVDWDRREVVIPNKTFITERLVNWTLTDPITRTTIRVGVAYGSDVALTEKLLLEIAHANRKVLKDPPPAALFLNFGESSLDFELRVFVKGIRDLVPATHEIHVAIDRAFRENNIEISFPQRDLHLDPKPIEVQLVDAARPKGKS